MSAPHKRAHPGGDLRVPRAAMFAAVCVVLAAVGHVVASCAAVPLWSLGAGLLAVFAVAAPLAGRERSLPGIAALLAVGQTVLHTLFGLGQHGTAVQAGSVDTSLVARAARLVCGASVAAISPAQAQRILADARIDAGTGVGAGAGAGPGAGAGAGHAVQHHSVDAMTAAAGSSASVLPSLPMLLGHVLAGVAAGWLLRHGDIALRRLMRLSVQGEGPVRALRGALALVRALLAGLPGTPEVPPRVAGATRLGPPAPRTTVLQHSVIRRGPPSAVDLALAA
ncbi:hypothetical protein G5C60_24445 [Streptomyces sp. HC44]|uniref:Integral membrane protein n=1 Tax=Streptomyces scabichelini TaxID=2711217 RepID=A0A6G4V967_9ACTN|nr:hypothetical protein [Streptomyces scabichelini]NGO10658.1 hypothetical protein [Streptomyces scabichelini]